jgi:myo-inositol-1(or 4)-monophosphatase
MPKYRTELAFARRTARQAGDILRRGLHRRREIHLKGRVDLVTQYDLKSERLITRALRQAFPDHAILAEESGATRRQSSHLWVIDPLDGTTNYAHGHPAFCVSIGLQVDGAMVLGVIYDPVRDEMFHAVAGQGGFLNSRRIHVSAQTRLPRSLLSTGFPYDIAESAIDNLDNFGRMYKASQGIRRGGSAALDLCYLACGRFDGFWELKLHPWDTAAGIVIVAEAGGKITDFHGRPYSIFGMEILASNGHIHRQMQKILLNHW